MSIGYLELNGDSLNINSPIIYLHGGPGGTITDGTIQLLLPLAKKNYDI